MKNRTSAVVACLALLSAPAMAQPHGDPGALVQLFVSPCGEPFRATAAAPYPVAAWFAHADANHDGAIDRAEFRADADAFFETLDVNHDGVLSSFEVSRYEHLVVPEMLQGHMSQLELRPRILLAQMDDMGGMGGMGAMGGLGGGGLDGGASEEQPFERKEDAAPSMEGLAPFNLLREPEPVASSDQNLDGRITRAEFESAADRRFGRLDVKGDGKLTLAALPMTVQEKMFGGRRRTPPRPS
jgi:hypothetical protein